MQIEQTSLPGVVILTPARFGDARGFFSETWSRRRLAEAGIDVRAIAPAGHWPFVEHPTRFAALVTELLS